MKRKICFLLVIIVFLMVCRPRYDWNAITIDNEANLSPVEFKNFVYKQTQEAGINFTEIRFIWKSRESKHYLEVYTCGTPPRLEWHNLPEKKEGLQIEWAVVFF